MTYIRRKVPRIDCAACGKTFLFRAAELKYTPCLYCSRSCASRVGSRMGAAAMQAKKPAVGTSRPCPRCGVPVLVTPKRSKTGRYVCVSCRRKESREDWRKRSAILCARKTASRRADPLYHAKTRAQAQLRRARQAGATVGVVDYDAIRKRDRMRCHICRKVVKERDLHFDHVIPLAAGGDHSNENIAVSHARCNTSKSASVVSLF